MDKALVIGIVGTIATIVFGFLSIDLFKRKRYPGKVTYIKLSLIDLLNNVADNFNEIELLHNKQRINKNLIYIKGALLNNGDIDINCKVTEKDITLQLPDGCKWLDIKPTDFSEGLNVNIKVDTDRDASFKFDLFRKNEFVQFEGLIESESKEISSQVINADLNFIHRIENTSKIEKKELLSAKEIKDKKYNAIRYSALILVLLFAISATSVFNIFGSKNETVYFKKNGQESNILYSVKHNEQMVFVDPKNGEDEFVTTLDDFNQNYKACLDTLTLWQKFKEYYWILSINFGLFLVLVLWELLDINKARKLNKILQK